MRPNNVFTSSSLINDIILCGTWPNECPARSDHIPVVTHLNIEIDRQVEAAQPNFKAANWEEVRKELSLKLANLDSGEDIPTEAIFLSHADKLTREMTGVIATAVPQGGPVPHHKHWWSRELTNKCSEVCRLT